MNTDQAKAELKRFGRYRTERVLELAAEGSPDQIHGSLLLAIASRETNLRNITGGGFWNNQGEFIVTGTDRGLWQINDSYHSAWLKAVPGCETNSYIEVFESCLPKGRVPGLTRAARKVISILRYNRTYALSQGVADNDALKVAVAGYNRGVGSSVQAYKKGQDVDSGTAMGNYSSDVLDRQRSFRRAVKILGWGK